MSFLARFVFASLMGLVVAGLIHIGYILYIPYSSDSSAYHRIKKLSPNNKPILIPTDGKDAFLPHPDPFMVLSACTFNVEEKMVRISVPKSIAFQSLSIHNTHGKVMFSVTDRAATSDSLEVVLGTSEQMEEYQRLHADKEDALRELYGTLENQVGYATLRVLNYSPSFTGIAQDAAQKLSCQPM